MQRFPDVSRTIYEIKIPLHGLGVDALFDGVQMGFGVFVNDGDTEAGQAGHRRRGGHRAELRKGERLIFGSVRGGGTIVGEHMRMLASSSVEANFRRRVRRRTRARRTARAHERGMPRARRRA